MVLDSAGKWLSVATVAARLETSERSVQRRCKDGRLRARLVPTPTGQAWEIDPTQFDPDTNDTNDGATTETPLQTTPTPQETTLPTQETTATTGNDTDGATRTTADDMTARYIAQIERENAFLRAQVEEGNRNAAELRAALREALRNAPKQLTAGNGASETEIPTTAPEQPQKPQPRLPLPSTYADLADQLERELNG